MKQKQIRNRLNRGNVRVTKDDRARQSRRAKLKGHPTPKGESLKSFLGRIAKKVNKSIPIDSQLLERIRKIKKKHQGREK